LAQNAFPMFQIKSMMSTRAAFVPFLDDQAFIAVSPLACKYLDSPCDSGEESLPCLLPGIAARRHQIQSQIPVLKGGYRTGSASPEKDRIVRRGVTFVLDDPSPACTPVCTDGGSPFKVVAGRRPPLLTLGTPNSCASASFRYHGALTPCTPDPQRGDLNLLVGNVSVLLFDFDGTLTRSAGTAAQRCRRQMETELRERQQLLGSYLQVLRESCMTLGIISKSSRNTIVASLEIVGLLQFFDQELIVGNAVGLEGKAGIIADLVSSGLLLPNAALDDDDISDRLCQIALVDDDVRELERCRGLGIQTYPAPEEGGLQEQDFDEIFAYLGVSSTGMRSVRHTGQP